MKPDKKVSNPQEQGVPAETNGAGPSHGEIQARAYEIYLERGGEHGQDQEDWFEAEQQLKAKQKAV